MWRQPRTDPSMTKALALLVALAATLLTAAAPPPEADPEGVVVSELVVQAKAAGPAWWRVSKGGSTVWVMGAPGGLPRGIKWDNGLLSARLTGARRLIVPPAYKAGLGDVFGAFGQVTVVLREDRAAGIFLDIVSRHNPVAPDGG